MALVSFLAVSRTVARNPDDSAIGRLRVNVVINDVSLNCAAVVIRNTTGRTHRVSIVGHDIDAPHDPADSDLTVDTSGLGLLAVLTLRGLRPAFHV